MRPCWGSNVLTPASPAINDAPCFLIHDHVPKASTANVQGPQHGSRHRVKHINRPGLGGDKGALHVRVHRDPLEKGKGV
jgi:hypothetical protein